MSEVCEDGGDGMRCVSGKRSEDTGGEFKGEFKINCSQLHSNMQQWTPSLSSGQPWSMLAACYFHWFASTGPGM